MSLVLLGRNLEPDDTTFEEEANANDISRLDGRNRAFDQDAK
ncbi:MAG: hypothetical protein OXG15_14890 [Gammaproteobacteria bacterium]|nr:hypothetical protein [Gammaproteobacteria bacterium]